MWATALATTYWSCANGWFRFNYQECWGLAPKLKKWQTIPCWKKKWQNHFIVKRFSCGASMLFFALGWCTWRITALSKESKASHFTLRSLSRLAGLWWIRSGVTLGLAGDTLNSSLASGSLTFKLAVCGRPQPYCGPVSNTPKFCKKLPTTRPCYWI